MNTSQTVSDTTTSHLESPQATSTPVRIAPRCKDKSNKRRSLISSFSNDSVTPRKRPLLQDNSSASIPACEESELSSCTENDHIQNPASPLISRDSLRRDVKEDELGVVKYFNVCGQRAAYIAYDRDIFIQCREVLQLAGMNVVNRGYAAVDMILLTKQLRRQPSFLIVKQARDWIRRSALLSLLRHKGSYHQAKKRMVEEAVLNIRKVDEAESSVIHPQNVTSDASEVPSASDLPVTLCGINITHYSEGEQLLLELDPLLHILDLKGHIKKNAWKYVDACLSKNGTNPSVSFNTVDFRKKRTHITVTGLNVLLAKFRPGNKENKRQLLQELPLAFSKVVAKNVSSSSVASCASTDPLVHLATGHYNGPKKVLLDRLIDSVAKRPIGEETEDFDGSISKDDLGYVMKGALEKNKLGKKKVQESTYDMYRHLHSINPEDIVHICDNYSGTRLMSEMRRKMPGIMPSAAQELKAKLKYKRQFQAVLCPRRTATGWCISPERLLQVLSFRYSFLSGPMKVRIWGDGREIGGRHSTFLALTILNHDLRLRGIPYQSPNETFPISVFYESDSRDNLEMNLGFDNIIERLCLEQPENDYYLCGDEMFLIKILDGSKELSPTSARGWNFYHEANKDQKRDTHSNGLRTDLPVPLDRLHPESLFPSIPLKNVVFDIMHGLTRIVEKLMNVEIEKILSEGNKGQQSNGHAPSTKQLLGNLVANVNRRGIRQGNFQIFFDKSGKVEPISLNKDHALGIISRAPAGKEEDYPHVLHNVVPRRCVKLPLSTEVRHFINVPEEMEEFEVVAKIWDSLCAMFIIAKAEPNPVLNPDAPQGSLHVEDYEWGHSESVLQEYKVHAECFYQLVRWRYSWENLTPYMIKFIDYGRHFLKYGDVPLARFQAEGGEHLNYQHNRHYFQHTTRHGGRHKMDPQFALLSAMYKKISYEINSGSGEEEVARQFGIFTRRHVAASQIQAVYRGHMVRRALTTEGFYDSVDPASKEEALRKTHSRLYPSNAGLTNEVLADFFFVFVGTIPMQKKRKWTHATLQRAIQCLGGKVCKTLPGNTKGRSTKRYHLLVNGSSVNRKVPDIIKEAIQRGYPILDFNFAFTCIDEGKVPDLEQFSINVSQLISVTREPTLHEQHFQKKPRMISLLKKKNPPESATNEPRLRLEKNAAQYYGNIKRKEAFQSQQYSFTNQAKMFGQECTNFRTLPAEVKAQYIAKWQEKKLQVEESLQARQNLSQYNIVKDPLFEKNV